MGAKLKGQSLKLIFFEYLISTGVFLLVSTGISVTAFMCMYTTGLIIPANYTENKILENREKIAGTNSFDKKMIPEYSSYLFISKDGQIISSSMSKEEQDKALGFHYNKDTDNAVYNTYIEIIRNDGYCIIHYSLKPHYTNRFMETYFPNANILFGLILLIMSMLSIFIVTLIWAKYLAGQLSSMLSAAEKIAERNLDFDMKYSGVKEFNTVLKGLEDMKTALKNSLIKEWRQEENRKNQITALTHDLKTPLSIIQGNAQLLQNTDITKEQGEYIHYIIKNGRRISDYIHELLIMSRTEDLSEYNPKELDMKQAAYQLADAAEEIMSVNQITLKIKTDVDNGLLSVDMALLERALQNILNNAVENSPDNTEVDLVMKTSEGFFEITVADNGSGFSEVDLTHAKEKFYRGDSGRRSTVNYGIGLFVTEQIIKLHGGTVSLKNRDNGRGACVTLKIPAL